MASRPSVCVSKPRADLRNASSIASREPLRKSREGPKRFWKCLHHRCNGPKVFFSICNGVANTRKFFVRLATVLQTPESFSRDLQRCCKRQKVFRGTCNTVANARKFFAGLATVLQTPESFSWDLQHCCKRQKVFRGTCNGVADARKFFVRLATVLQTLKSSSGHLQHSCKRQKVFRGTCNGVASDKKYFSAFAELPRGISKNTLAVIALYPSHSSGIRSLILLFKLTLQRFLEREIRRRGHPFRSDRSLGGHTLLRSISEVPI